MERRRYWLRLARLFVVALVAALVLFPFGLGVAMMWGLTHTPCPRTTFPGALGLDYEEVDFQTPQGLTLQAYFLPGSNGATVLIAPTYTNNRGGDLEDAAILNRAGFNVLTFDSRVCQGASFHSLGYLEAEDAEAALRYLESRPEVDPNRISIHGFSSGGSTSLFTAARVPGIRAVSAKGGYHDFAEQLGVGRGGTISVADSLGDATEDPDGGTLNLGSLFLSASAVGGNSVFGSGLGGDAFGGTIDIVLDRHNASWSSLFAYARAQDGESALDPVGGPVFAACLKTLQPLGSAIAIGFAGGAWEPVDPARLVGRNTTVVGFYLGRLMGMRPDLVREEIHELLALWRRGAIRPVVGAEYPLEQANEAHDFIASRQSTGKVVLVP